jgi:hypothetical protein
MNKARRAILVELVDHDGSFQVRLHDVVRREQDRSTWKRDAFYTEKGYDRKVVEDMAFDDSDMTDLGVAIMARLWAFLERGEA